MADCQLRMHLTDRPDHGPCIQCAARLLGICPRGKAHARVLPQVMPTLYRD